MIQAAGHRAWLCGGCVRDALLGREPQDFDLVTDASMAELQGLFSKVILVGQQFGVLRVLFEGEEFEIAQFRKEADYKDGRHPSLVEPGTPEEDAHRRDLTVNALFYDPQSDQIFDFVGGLDDLKTKTLRAVGKATQRFQEDHLRVLRAIRFRSQLGFQWDPELESSLQSCLYLLKKVSRERIRDELVKMTLGSFWAQMPEILVQLNLSQFVFESIQLKKGSHIDLHASSPFEVWCEWGLWMHRSGVPASDLETQLRSLKLSNEEWKTCEGFLTWFQSEEWQKKPLGELVDLSFKSGVRRGWFVWQSLHSKTWSPESRFVELLEQFPSPPLAWFHASDFAELKGPALGAMLKKAWFLQLSGEFSSKAELQSRL